MKTGNERLGSGQYVLWRREQRFEPSTASTLPLGDGSAFVWHPSNDAQGAAAAVFDFHG